MYKEIKLSLCEVNKTQVWLVHELGKRGIYTDKTELSSVIAGTRTGPKAELIIKTAQDIIAEYKEKLTDDS